MMSSTKKLTARLRRRSAATAAATEPLRCFTTIRQFGSPSPYRIGSNRTGAGMPTPDELKLAVACGPDAGSGRNIPNGRGGTMPALIGGPNKFTVASAELSKSDVGTVSDE